MENDSYDQWIKDNDELCKEIPELINQQGSVREYSEHKDTELNELLNVARLALKDQPIFWNNYFKPLYDINVRYNDVSNDLTHEQNVLLLSREHSMDGVESWEKNFQDVCHEVANRVEVLTKLKEDLDRYKSEKGRIDREHPIYQVASMIHSLQWLIQQKALNLRSCLLNKKRMSRKNEFFECSKIEACIGIGGFGIVFHTRGAIDERSYAAKVFNSKANKNKDAINVELDAISKLRHPRIANFHYFGIDDRIPKNEDMLKMVKEFKDKNKPKSTELSTMFFVMDFYEDTLASWLKANPTKQQRSLPKIKKCLYQLCEGLYEIHRSKMIHRDIKPDNIFLDKDELLIGDLGLATIFRTETDAEEFYDLDSFGDTVLDNDDGGNVSPSEVTESSISSKFTSKSVDDVISNSSKAAMSSTDDRATEETKHDIQKLTNQVKNKLTVGVGTPWYKAPEQDESHGLYGAKVDVYALGKVFFEMLLPNSTVTGRNMDFDKLAKDGICPEIADEEKKMILKLTQRKEADRPDIAELIEDPYFDDIKNTGPSSSTASDRWDDFAYAKENNPDGSVTKTKIPIAELKKYLKNKYDNN